MGAQMLQVREIEWHFFPYRLVAIYSHKGRRALWFRYIANAWWLEDSRRRQGQVSRKAEENSLDRMELGQEGQDDTGTPRYLITFPERVCCRRGSEHRNRRAQIPHRNLSVDGIAVWPSVFLVSPASCVVNFPFGQPHVWQGWVRRTDLTLVQFSDT